MKRAENMMKGDGKRERSKNSGWLWEWKNRGGQRRVAVAEEEAEG